MSRETILMIIGALVALSPWSGLPVSWLEWVLLVFGLLVIGIGFTLRKRRSDIFSKPPDSLPPASMEYTEAPGELYEKAADVPRVPKSRSSRIAMS